MKKPFVCGMLSLLVGFTSAQTTPPVVNDAARIVITPYVDAELGFNDEISKQLTNKMNAILTKQGLAGSKNQRFIITANANILSEDIIVTTTEMYQYELEVNFIIGDGIDGIIFAMASQTVKGVGETQADAFLKAIRKIKPTDPAFQTLVSDAKTKILAYYNTQCDAIIAEAKTFTQEKNYDAAIYNLMEVPEICTDCHDKCMRTANDVYQAKIDEENAKVLIEARAIWNAGKNTDAGREAGLMLATIDINSNVYDDAVRLSEEINAHLNAMRQQRLNQQKEQAEKEWMIQLQQQQEAAELERAKLNAMRDISIAYNENQQQPTYNTTGWWGNVKTNFKNLFL